MQENTKSIVLLPSRIDEESKMFLNQISSLNKQSFKSLKANDKDWNSSKQKLD